MSTIITRNSATSGSVPSSLIQGELAINVTDGRLFYGSGSGNIVKEFVASGSGGGGTVNTGSFVTTSSFNAYTGSNTSQFAGTASYATTASYYGGSVLSASYAQTASYAPAYLPLTGGTINGNVTINGTASIAFLNVTYESSSVIYSSGSNQFGDASNDVQTLWGTVDIKSGPVLVTGSVNASGGFTGSLQGTASYATQSLSASYAQTASYVTTAQTASYVLSSSYAQTASYVQNAQTASYVTTAQTASYVTGSIFTNGNRALSASYAITASYIQTAQTASYVLSSSYATTASYAINALSASYAPFVATNTGSLLVTASISNANITFTKGDSTTFGITVNNVSSASYASTSSYVLNAISASYSTNALSASYATTASYALNGGGGAAFPYTGSALITGSLGITGSLSVSGSIIARSSTATPNALARWSGSAGGLLTLTGSILNSNNTQVWVGTVNSNTLVTLYPTTSSITTGLSVYSPYGINSYGTYTQGNQVGIQSVALGSSTAAYGGLYTAYDTATTYGIYSTVAITEFGSITTGIGGYFDGKGDGAYAYPTNMYSVQLVDGTEGVGKVLVSQTSDGKANWAQTVNSASVAVTASYARTALSASYAVTASFVTGSIFANGNSALSSSYSVTASYATRALSASYAPSTPAFPYTGSAGITGSLTVVGPTTSTQIGAGAAPSGSVPLDVRAQGALSTDIAFRVRNSANTLDAFKVQGDNEVNVRYNLSLGLYAAGATRKLYMVRDAETYGIDLDWSGAGTTGARITNSGTGANTALIVNSYNGTSNFALSISNGDISIGGASGTKIGISNTQKLSLWNATPIVQPTASTAIDTLLTNTGLRATGGNANFDTPITASRAFISSSNGTVSGSSLIVYGSGSAQPVFTVQGSQGELFSITDSLSGSLFSVNDISGLPIMEVFSDNTTLMGSYLAPSLNTTAKVVQTNSGSFTMYSLPTASYDTAFFEYSVRSGSNARAGIIMAIQSGSAVNFTETTTTDFGSTSAVSFTVIVTGSNIALTGSSTSGAWTIKTIVRSI